MSGTYGEHQVCNIATKAGIKDPLKALAAVDTMDNTRMDTMDATWARLTQGGKQVKQPSILKGPLTPLKLALQGEAFRPGAIAPGWAPEGPCVAGMPPNTRMDGWMDAMDAP